jgi:hypothetical protein
MKKDGKFWPLGFLGFNKLYCFIHYSVDCSSKSILFLYVMLFKIFGLLLRVLYVTIQVSFVLFLIV